MTSKRSIYIGFLFLIILAVVVFASKFIDDTQSDFDQGTYINTTYNGSALILSGSNTSGTYTSQIFDAGSDALWNNLSWIGSITTGYDSFLISAIHSGENKSEVFSLDSNYYLADMKDSSKKFYLNFSENLFDDSVLKVYARENKGVTIGIYAQSDESGTNPLGTFTVSSATGDWYNITLNIGTPTNAIWLGEGTGSGTDPKDEFDYIYAEVSGTNLSFQIKNCSQSDCSEGTWQNIDLNNLNLNSRYSQYKVSFTSPDSSITPALYNVTIDYTLSNHQPIVSSLTLTPSQPRTNNDLTCPFTITDADAGDSLSANITWYKNNEVYSSINQSVSNGTEETLLITYENTVKTEEWNCTVTPYDGTAYGQEASNKATILNSPPTIPDIYLTPSPPYTNNDLNVAFNQASQDNDSDTITYTYRWYRDGVYQPGITGSTVSDGITSKNEVWVVNVTANDGTVNSEKDTDSVTIQNSPPSITSASIAPTTAYKTSILTVSTQGWSDLDGEYENYLYQWFNQNGKINGANSTTLTGTYFNKSHQIYCNVTPYDSDEYGVSKITNTVTIQNSLPILTVNLASELGFNGTDEDLIGSFTYSDDDSDTITNNQTKWYRNSIEQTNLANLTQISYTNTSAEDVWIFSARAHDGESWSNWYNASITILDISQTYPTLISPANNTYFNVSNVVLTYRTPNYANMNCTIYADTSANPTTQIKNNTNIGARTTVIYNWINIADNAYNWKVSCINGTTMLNSTIKSFTIDTIYPTTAPTLTQDGVADSDKDGNIELLWTADPDANTYNIYRSATEILDASDLTKIHSTSLTSWEDNTTLHNNVYWYALTTVDAAGNENKSIVSESFNTTADDAIKPKIPVNLNASSLNGVTTLYWTKTTQDSEGNSDEFSLQYKIWYRQNSTVNLSKTSVNETADYIKTIAQCSTTLCQTTHSLSGSTRYYYFITTIDDANNENLTLDNNFANVTITTAPPSNTGVGGGGSGGGGGGSTIKKECKEEWSCSGWYSCINNLQARTCVDINKCGTNINKPEETRACQACVEKWQCGDWTPCVNNRQTRICIDKNDCETEKNKPEETQDCMLDTCSDKIKNYGEVGIDCGGPCKPCKASDFITGGAIALKATEGPNPFLLIPTIILLIAFIVIKSIRKSDIKFRKVVSAMHIPMIILIIALFIFSFFGPQITGLFIADHEPINEELDYEKSESKIEDISIFEFDKTKAKIASAIFLVIISITLVGFVVKKKFQTKKEIEKGLEKAEEEPGIEKPKVEGKEETKPEEKAEMKEKPQVEEQELPLDIKEEKVPTQETEEKPKPKEEEKLPIREIKDMEIEIDLLKEQEKKIKWEIYKEKQDKNKQEIINRLKEAYSK